MTNETTSMLAEALKDVGQEEPAVTIVITLSEQGQMAYGITTKSGNPPHMRTLHGLFTAVMQEEMDEWLVPDGVTMQ